MTDASLPDAIRPQAASGPPDAATLRDYAEVVRALLAHGGYERTGDVLAAKKWDFDHITQWLDAHGRPDRRRTVHVAGSKGKGSVASMTAAIVRATGAHTLLMTSPDLHSARERIQVDGAPLDYVEFTAVARELLADPDAAGWSYFEMLTVMGWIAGRRAGCDWQVVEVGLGGRLDTTNALAEKLVAVVTPIDLEHVQILGDSIPAIAREKAGIITGPCEVLVPPMRQSAVDVVRARADEVGATFHELTDECAIRVVSSGLDGQKLDVRTPVRTYRNLETALAGAYQVDNLVTALRAAELAWSSAGEELPEAAVREGLRRFRMPGRFEVLQRKPLVIIDGLHTPLAARRFLEAVRALPVPRRRAWVLGVLSDKAVDELARTLFGEGDDVVVVPVGSARSAAVGDVVRAVNATGAIAQRAGSIEEGIDRASELVGAGGAVLVVGSLYVAAAAREHLLGVAGDHALGIR
ncbi:MAG: folylpolyglutamate synthase/dihydrofolate synthase family protein [Dehalococcoidia bacterium]